MSKTGGVYATCHALVQVLSGTGRTVGFGERNAKRLISSSSWRLVSSGLPGVCPGSKSVNSFALIKSEMSIDSPDYDDNMHHQRLNSSTARNGDFPTER